MSKSDYVKSGNQAFATQQLTFRNAVGSYAGVLNLTAEQIAAQAADAVYFAYELERGTVLTNSSRQSSTWLTLIRKGGTPPPSGAPVDPTLPETVAAVNPDIEGRFRALVRQIKAHPAYNEAIGLALGIEGPQGSGPDLNQIQPELKLTVAGNKVEVGWGWQGHSSKLDMIEILVNRGAGFTLLTFDSTPGYTDTAPHPATPEKWTYKAIYRKGDEQVGQWSPEVSVTVGG